ncbi:MAG: Fur family transcriptional regulator [Gemmatimonadota bacterium]
MTPEPQPMTVLTSPPLGCAAVMMEVLRGQLRERGVPFTHQREAIAQVLFESMEHLSADEMALALEARGEHPGKATIYRTLGLLVEVGLATEHDFDEGFRRYQMQAGVAHHDHLICTSCGTVTEFQHPGLESLQEDASGQHGFEAISRQLKIYGVCSACAGDAGL